MSQETRNQEKSKRLNLWNLRLKNGSPGGIRTHDHLLRRQVLYPTELPDHTYCKVILIILPLWNVFSRGGFIFYFVQTAQVNFFINLKRGYVWHIFMSY